MNSTSLDHPNNSVEEREGEAVEASVVKCTSWETTKILRVRELHRSTVGSASTFSSVCAKLAVLPTTIVSRPHPS